MRNGFDYIMMVLSKPCKWQDLWFPDNQRQGKGEKVVRDFTIGICAKYISSTENQIHFRNRLFYCFKSGPDCKY